MFGLKTKKNISTNSNKSYFSLSGSQIDGTTYVTANTLETIAALAIKDVNGVASLNGSAGEKIASVINKNTINSKGIKISANQDSSLNVAVNLSLEQGSNVPKVALDVQNVVKNSINEYTDLIVNNVDIIIDGFVTLEKKNNSQIEKKVKKTSPVKKSTAKTVTKKLAVKADATKTKTAIKVEKPATRKIITKTTPRKNARNSTTK
jgi:uncharacterized alkaline shock family protein YloU